MSPSLSSFFFFNDTATTEIYTLSLHDALPISASRARSGPSARPPLRPGLLWLFRQPGPPCRDTKAWKSLRLRKDELLPRANAVGSELVHRHQLRQLHPMLPSKVPQGIARPHDHRAK